MASYLQLAGICLVVLLFNFWFLVNHALFAVDRQPCPPCPHCTPCALCAPCLPCDSAAHDNARVISAKNNCAPLKAAPQQKIAFLFLVKTDFPHDRIWDSFFDPAYADLYSIYIHPKPNMTSFPSRFSPFLIPAVASEWGVNLLDAQMQLLFYALGDPLNARFMFVSDSTIPLKLFPFVYNTLMASNGSSFCVCPRNQSIATFALVSSELKHMFPDAGNWRKADMWSILTRKHAAFIHRNAILARRTMKLFDTGTDYIVAPDEHLFISFLYNAGQHHEINKLQSISDNNTVHQGDCPTYFLWSDFTSEHMQYRAAPALSSCKTVDVGANSEQPWMSIARQLESMKLSPAMLEVKVVATAMAMLLPPLCAANNPFFFTRVSETDFDMLLRNPALLMGRKFHEKCKVVLTSQRCGSIGQALDLGEFLKCSLKMVTTEERWRNSPTVVAGCS